LIQKDKYISFASHVSFRGLECPYLFDKSTDELYELDDDGIKFFSELDGKKTAGEVENTELLEYSDSEGLLQYSDSPLENDLARGRSPVPSLRYLEVILTRRCNLSCGHCYLGDMEKADMGPDLLAKVLEEFDGMQGLRLLLSGGEPLLYPHLEKLADLITGRGFRSVLLTNGVLLDKNKLEMVPVHEVQVSIDGMEKGHEALRGEGTFAKSLKAAEIVLESGVDLSVATMIHAGNLDEIEELGQLVEKLGAKEWSLETPSELGRWTGAGGLSLPLEKAAEYMEFGFGGSYHGSGEGRACGLHLATLMPDGALLPCGFYPDRPLGNVSQDGLLESWRRKKVPMISEIELCSDCPDGDECAGGCRYRAGETGPDVLMCAARGWPAGVTEAK